MLLYRFHDLGEGLVTAVHAVSSGYPGGGARQQMTVRRPTQPWCKCYQCGGNHFPGKCRFKDSECHYCGKKGHIAKVCRSKSRGSKFNLPREGVSKPSQRTHHVHGDDKDDTPYGSEQLFNVGGRKSSPPLMVTVEVSRAELQMEVDTRASVSIISHETYTKLWEEKDRPRLHHSARKLHTYTGEELVVKGKITVDVGYEDQRKSLPLLVVEGKGPSLLG